MNKKAKQPAEDCLPRARRLLTVMAMLAIAAAVWNILRTDLASARELILVLVGAIVPVLLVQMIWRGRNVARFALAGYCLFVLWNMFPSFAATRQLMQDGEYAASAFYVLVFVGHGYIGLTAMFAKSITELIDYRQEQKETPENERPASGDKGSS